MELKKKRSGLIKILLQHQDLKLIQGLRIQMLLLQKNGGIFADFASLQQCIDRLLISRFASINNNDYGVDLRNIANELQYECEKND